MGVTGGLIGKGMDLVFGGGRGVIAETAEVFRENAEAAGLRQHDLARGAMAQFGAEFAAPRRGWFDAAMDGVNRLPRPMMALGTLGLIAAAMIDPVWFASRMQGIALVPEPLWWLMGAIVSFYFGARHQAVGQAFRASVAGSVARAGIAAANVAALRALGEGAGPPEGAAPAAGADPFDGNAALAEWRAGQGDG